MTRLATAAAEGRQVPACMQRSTFATRNLSIRRARVVTRAQQTNQQATQQSQDQQQQVAQGGAGPTGLNVGRYRPTSPAGWAEMAAALRQSNVKCIAPQELPWALERGALLVDIRPEGDFLKGHLPDAANVEFFRIIQGWSAWQAVRRLGYTLLGASQTTEPNPEFVQDMLKAVDAQEGAVVLYCNLGGSLEPTPNDPNGFQTRSMVAAYALVRAGFKNVYVLKGGYAEWANAGREIETFE